VVLLFVIVGLAEVAQQTPRAVTAEPPSLVILPPLVAVVEVRAETAVVVKTGKIAVAAAVTWFPYAVPILFVA
jgi:hypothetical protein